jgi:hypothetical protein
MTTSTARHWPGIYPLATGWRGQCRPGPASLCHPCGQRRGELGACPPPRAPLHTAADPTAPPSHGLSS